MPQTVRNYLSIIAIGIGLVAAFSAINNLQTSNALASKRTNKAATNNKNTDGIIAPSLEKVFHAVISVDETGAEEISNDLIKFNRKRQSKLGVICESDNTNCQGKIFLSARVMKGKKPVFFLVAAFPYNVARSSGKTIKFKPSKAAERILSKVKRAKGVVDIRAEDLTTIKSTSFPVSFKLTK